MHVDLALRLQQQPIAVPAAQHRERRRGWVDYEVPTFPCPWAPPGRRCLIKHGPAYRSDAGDEFVPQLDGNGLTHKVSHCGNPDAPRGYFLRPLAMSDLPRRVVAPDGGPL